MPNVALFSLLLTGYYRLPSRYLWFFSGNFWFLVPRLSKNDLLIATGTGIAQLKGSWIINFKFLFKKIIIARKPFEKKYRRLTTGYKSLHRAVYNF